MSDTRVTKILSTQQPPYNTQNYYTFDFPQGMPFIDMENSDLWIPARIPVTPVTPGAVHNVGLVPIDGAANVVTPAEVRSSSLLIKNVEFVAGGRIWVGTVNNNVLQQNMELYIMDINAAKTATYFSGNFVKNQDDPFGLKVSTFLNKNNTMQFRIPLKKLLGAFATSGFNMNMWGASPQLRIMMYDTTKELQPAEYSLGSSYSAIGTGGANANAFVDLQIYGSGGPTPPLVNTFYIQLPHPAIPTGTFVAVNDQVAIIRDVNNVPTVLQNLVDVAAVSVVDSVIVITIPQFNNNVDYTFQPGDSIVKTLRPLTPTGGGASKFDLALPIAWQPYSQGYLPYQVGDPINIYSTAGNDQVESTITAIVYNFTNPASPTTPTSATITIAAAYNWNANDYIQPVATDCQMQFGVINVETLARPPSSVVTPFKIDNLRNALPLGSLVRFDDGANPVVTRYAKVNGYWFGGTGVQIMTDRSLGVGANAGTAPVAAIKPITGFGRTYANANVAVGSVSSLVCNYSSGVIFQDGANSPMIWNGMPFLFLPSTTASGSSQLLPAPNGAATYIVTDFLYDTLAKTLTVSFSPPLVVQGQVLAAPIIVPQPAATIGALTFDQPMYITLHPVPKAETMPRRPFLSWRATPLNIPAIPANGSYTTQNITLDFSTTAFLVAVPKDGRVQSNLDGLSSYTIYLNSQPLISGLEAVPVGDDKTIYNDQIVRFFSSLGYDVGTLSVNGNNILADGPTAGFIGKVLETNYPQKTLTIKFQAGGAAYTARAIYIFQLVIVTP